MKQIDFVDLPPPPVATQADNTTSPASGEQRKAASKKKTDASSTATAARKRGRPAKQGGGHKSPSTAVRDGYRRLTADIPAALHKELKMQALQDDCTVTDLIIEAAETLLSSRS